MTKKNLKNKERQSIVVNRSIFEMKFAGKRRKSTEGVTLSGAGQYPVQL